MHSISKNILFVWIGSVGNVHLSCLERWINECGVDRCELCLFQFTSDQTRRYTVWQSLMIWTRNPVHRSLLISDSIVMIVLTVVMACLITSVVMGMTVFSTSKTDR
ncbi:E3 ubiquitin-protein ligase MARCH3-like [Aphis craccivora]|uniref:E3 ubiquitin-protein ligase MARCH3-like n=1 Tax=Aphis craccivora TaxID=307492 RepID=A0A6G0VS12_APHCR|nr:E3 ubiquitin-protein ligase MARCH3-like [Aphis craccivora]